MFVSIFVIPLIITLVSFSSAFAESAPVVKLINPIGGSAENPEGQVSPQLIAGGIIQKVFTILGSVALLAFVLGGAEWLSSAGNPEKVKKGTQIMLWAVIGLFLIFVSYAILNVIFISLGAVGLENTTNAPAAP